MDISDRLAPKLSSDISDDMALIIDHLDHKMCPIYPTTDKSVDIARKCDQQDHKMCPDIFQIRYIRIRYVRRFTVLCLTKNVRNLHHELLVVIHTMVGLPMWLWLKYICFIRSKTRTTPRWILAKVGVIFRPQT